MKNGLIIDEYGAKCWYQNDKLHREDGPTIVDDNVKYWYINGQLHREDGPAIENLHGAQRWFFRGNRVNCQSQEEFERKIKLLAFL